MARLARRARPRRVRPLRDPHRGRWLLGHAAVDRLRGADRPRGVARRRRAAGLAAESLEKSLLAQLVEGAAALVDGLEPHAAQHARRFGELDVAVVDDL